MSMETSEVQVPSPPSKTASCTWRLARIEWESISDFILRGRGDDHQVQRYYQHVIVVDDNCFVSEFTHIAPNSTLCRLGVAHAPRYC